MQAPSRKVHVRRILRDIEFAELQTQPLRMLRLNTRHGSRAEEPREAVVTKTPDHSVS
jgi:hypothetical protein